MFQDNPLSILFFFHLSLPFSMHCVQHLMTTCRQGDANELVSKIACVFLSFPFHRPIWHLIFSPLPKWQGFPQTVFSVWLHGNIVWCAESPLLKNILQPWQSCCSFRPQDGAPTWAEDATVINCLIRTKTQHWYSASQCNDLSRF